MADRRTEFATAMDRLVALLPGTALLAETDPAGFIHSVADELERLQALVGAEDEGEGSDG